MLKKIELKALLNPVFITAFSPVLRCHLWIFILSKNNAISKLTIDEQGDGTFSPWPQVLFFVLVTKSTYPINIYVKLECFASKRITSGCSFVPGQPGSSCGHLRTMCQLPSFLKKVHLTINHKKLCFPFPGEVQLVGQI